MAFMKIAGGLAGNLSEVSVEQLEKEYGQYLMYNETISIGFKLTRDTVIFTNMRIIDFDKQGATGKKMSVESINMTSIVDVVAETAGFGLDDSEIKIAYMVNPYYKSHAAEFKTKKFEFPKKYDIQPVYKMLQETAYENVMKLNS